jgi:LysM repeat protein
VELPRRGGLAHFAAPAAFLLAVTIAGLLVRAGFEGGSSDSGGVTTALTTTTTATTTEATTTTITQPAKRFYVIQAGDTLDVVAARYGKTVDELLALNPDIDPHALRIGQKIRIG